MAAALMGVASLAGGGTQSKSVQSAKKLLQTASQAHSSLSATVDRELHSTVDTASEVVSGVLGQTLGPEAGVLAAKTIHASKALLHSYETLHGINTHKVMAKAQKGMTAAAVEEFKKAERNRENAMAIAQEMSKEKDTAKSSSKD